MTVHLQREIETLKSKLRCISSEVEVSIQRAVTALQRRDLELAKRVVAEDEKIDRMEVEIEEDCLKILALYSPVANDLRFVIAVLKINNDLERIADQAVNVAERAIFLTSKPPIEIPQELSLMMERAQHMLRDSLNAFFNMDTELARRVINEDDEMDDLHRRMYELVEQRLHSQPERFDCTISILVASRNLERIADQVTNIAEDVIYLVEGAIVRHSGNL